MSSQNHTDRDAQTTITRRTLLKASAAAVPAAMLGTNATTEAKAASLGPLPVSPKAMSVVDWAGGTINQTSGVDEDPDANEISLHQTAMSAKEWFDTVTTYAQNHLEDAKTMAHIEARNAIATAYENGKSDSEASAQAIAAIEDYYAQSLYRNHIEVVCSVLMQLAHVSHAARSVDNSQVNDEFVSDFSCVKSYSGSGSISDQYLGDIKTTTLTSLDGDTTFETQCPEIVVEFDNGDRYKSPITDEWLNSPNVSGRDPLIGNFTVTTENGETLELRYEPTVISLPDVDLQSHEVWSASAVARDLVDISNQLDSLKSDYDLTFAGDIYTALDNGTVTPSQVRGVGSQARHLAGGDAEVTEDAYQLAMYQQLGMQGPELDTTASMTVSYTGGTSYEVRNDSDRRRVPADTVTDKQYAGLLYGSGVGSIASGDVCYTDPTAYVPGGNTIKAYDPVSATEKWSIGSFSDPDGKTMTRVNGAIHLQTRDILLVYGVDTGNNGHGCLASVDSQTGEMRNFWAPSIDFEGVTATNGEDTLVGGGNGGQLHIWEWNDSLGEFEFVESRGGSLVSTDRIVNHPTAGVVVAAKGLYQMQLSDGSAASSAEPSAATGSVAKSIAQTGSTIYSSSYDGTFAWSVSAATGPSLKWQATVPSFDIQAYSNVVYVASDDTSELVALNPSDGSERWRKSISEAGRVKGIAAPPDGSYFLLMDDSDTLHEYDADVTHQQSISTGGAYGGLVTYSRTNRTGVSPTPDAHAHSAVFYDASGSAEKQLADGVLKINSMSDTKGEEITPVTQQTIDDIVAQANGAESIEDVIAQSSSIDSADEIDGTDDLKTLVREVDGLDSVNGVTTETQNYEDPEYDSYDNQKWAEYQKKVDEQYAQALEQHYEKNSIGGGGIVGGSSGGLVGGVVVGGLALLGLKGFADRDD